MRHPNGANSKFSLQPKEGIMAIKVLIKRKIKDGNMQAASRLLINTRSGAMKQPGYISSESLRNLDEPDQIIVMSMWQNREDWEAWRNSDARKAIVSEFRDYIVGETEYEYFSLGIPFE
jgi:heme-degrading monooxygenase HmoA